MNKYPDFWNVVIGPGPVGAFLGFTALAFATALVSILLELSNRNVASKFTPVNISWKFFWVNNLPRFVANFLAIPLLIRLSYSYISPELMIITAIGIGAGIDRGALLLKKIGVLSNNRYSDKIVEKLAPNQPTVIPPTE